MYFFQAICSKLFYKLEDFQYSEYIQFTETYPIFGKFSNSFIQNVKLLYSVMQSDGNSFCGDVVLDSFNKTYRDEDNILDQIYKSKYVRIITMMILILYNIIRKSILRLQ